MPPTNNFLPFCPTDTGTNLPSQGDYAAAADRTSGNKPGIASSMLNNKALRQANFITSQTAQFIADTLGADVLDDAISAKLLAQINATYRRFAPNLTKLLTGSGTWRPTYYFFIASGNATAAATYTNNGATFTVKSTIASGVLLETTGTNVPAVSGTLTRTSGSGDATLTFYAYRSALWLEIKAVAGAGGGAGGGTAGVGSGGDGSDTTFGPITCSGGLGGTNNGPGGTGGAASLGSGPEGLAFAGGWGTAGNGGTAIGLPSGDGGNSIFGGAGGGSENGAAGRPAAANSGSGGSGGTGSVANIAMGGGGGAGGGVLCQIKNPSATGYAYSIGVGGTAGALGANGTAGAAGADGCAEVIEHF